MTNASPDGPCLTPAPLPCLREDTSLALYRRTQEDSAYTGDPPEAGLISYVASFLACLDADPLGGVAHPKL